MTDPADRQLLTGWGRTSPTAAAVLAADSREALVDAVLHAGARGIIARGLGRSYGDAAQNGGGTVVELGTSAMALDESGVLTVEAGASLDEIMRFALPQGWFVPVTPGTRYVTIGGAIAADIHGKNHHVTGSFTEHVLSLELITADGQTQTLTAQDELFWATAGGMGLTGIIMSARVQMLAVETSWMSVDTERAANLDDLMSRLSATDHLYRYSVAWIDCLAKGAKMGRAVITRGDHAPMSRLPGTKVAKGREFAPGSLLAAPGFVPNGLLRPLTVSAFNELWFRKAPRERRDQLQRISTFFHPLDGVKDWNRIYGSEGFLQYQFVVPLDAEPTLRGILERISGLGVPSFLAVLKRFGPGNSGLLSFPTSGWTLALDIPTQVAGLAELLDRLDDEVVSAGGRIYLAKDSRVRASLLPAMYPRLEEFRAVRARVDPNGVFRSDLARRLDL